MNKQRKPASKIGKVLFYNGRHFEEPTQHVNPPTDDRTMTWFNHYRVFKGEGEEWVKMMTEPQDGEGEE